MNGSTPGKGRILLPLIFHLHQPAGNFPGTFAHAFRRSYEPLVGALEKSGLRFNLHISGALLDWLAVNQRRFIDRLRSLSVEGRVEILGGGYYEPILPMIPPADRQRQLTRLADRVEGLFGRRPRGAWLAERVWEPVLAAEFARAGYQYTLLDDRHLHDLGWRDDDVHRIFSTEQDGEVLAIFPISEPIRYLIPWSPPAKTVEYLFGCRPTAGDADSVVVVMSDAEKMGLWPARRGTTYDLCYREGWMARFLRKLSSTEWIKAVLLSEALDSEPPRQLVYLPSASYDRMALWALPTEARRRLETLPDRLERAGLAPGLRADVERFIGGTHWRNFLVKYPAADRLHKAYLYVRDRLLAAEDSLGPADVDRLWDHLDAAAVNDVYWHGLFGGVYYHFLRHHCYRRLGEVLARLDGDAGTGIERYDYERIGRFGALISDRRGTVVLDHAGAVLDWISKMPPAGLAGGFTRIAEPYHRGDERGFTVDGARRGFCRVAVMPGKAAKERLLAGRGAKIFPELEGPLIRDGRVAYEGKVMLGAGEVDLGLEYSPVRGGWRCAARLFNPGPTPVVLTFALDSTPSPPSGPRDLELSLRFRDRDGRVSVKTSRRNAGGSVQSWSLTDRRMRLCITSEVEPAADLWSSPLYTVERTEAGFKRSWQGLQVAWAWPLRLEPGEGRVLTARFTHSATPRQR